MSSLSKVSEWKWPLLFIALSFLVHFFLFILLRNSFKWSSPAIPKNSSVVFVRLPQNDGHQDKPIVTTPKPAWEQIPKKPSAQGLYNQTVSQETVSPHGGPAKRATPPQKKKPSLESPKESPKKGPSTQTKQEPLLSETSQPQPTPEPKTSPGIPDTPSSSGGGNYLPHFKVGDTTYLNVLANPQIAYFVELKRKLELAWNPRRLLGEQKNRLGGLSQIVVVIGFKISSRGELSGLVTINPSLLETYDNEAKRAIRVSAPFTSPPAHLLKEDGALHLAVPFIVYLR